MRFGKSSTFSTTCADYSYREHLMRVHRIPMHCARCSQTFKTADERDAHLRQQSQCLLGPLQQWDGIRETQKVQLGERVSSKNTKQENWYFIFTTLVHNSDFPKNPFLDDVQFPEDLVAASCPFFEAHISGVKPLLSLESPQPCPSLEGVERPPRAHFLKCALAVCCCAHSWS